MHLENVVFDALEPQRLGRFWEAVVAGERLTDEPGAFETRYAVDGGPVLDLCFQQVPDVPDVPPRLVLQLLGGADEVDRVLALGAHRLDGGRGTALLADPEGNPFEVLPDRAPTDGSGGLAVLRLDTADPAGDAGLWAWLTGWTSEDPAVPGRLRHPSRRGPLLELRAQPAGKGAAKNRLHLDVRLGAGEDADAVEAGVVERGGVRFDPGWGELPWRSYLDRAGNELCVLPAPR